MKYSLIRGMMVLAMVLIFCGSAIASDVPTGGDCDNFGHNWGDNISCEGKFTLADMGHFDNGVWQWDPDFYALVDGDNYSAWHPNSQLENNGWDAMIPHPNTETVVNYWRVDNKRYPNGDLNHRVAGMDGYTGGVMFPSVWKIRVDDPASATNPWIINDDPITFDSYPYYITHVDWFWANDCASLCYDWGCEFDSGPVTLPNGYICDWGDHNTTITVYGGVEMNVDGEERLSPENVSHIVLNGQTEYPSYLEHGKFYSLNYNTGSNSQGGDYVGVYTDLYFHHNDGLLPVNGPQVAVLHMKNNDEINLTYEVNSDRVMPTVAAKTYFTDLVDLSTKDKSGKKIKATEIIVEVDNITARELDGQLIIQWSEPDGAFQAPLPGTNGIRLRMWVGDMTNTDNLEFLWIDAPVMTGTIIVPADKWSMIKTRMAAIGRTYVDIGGMYREQFPTFHNRGYLESIEYTF